MVGKSVVKLTIDAEFYKIRGIIQVDKTIPSLQSI